MLQCPDEDLSGHIAMASNGPSPALLGYEDLTKQYNRVVSKPLDKEELQELEKQRSIQFKASHTLLIGFFLWIGFDRHLTHESALSNKLQSPSCPWDILLHERISSYATSPRFEIGMHSPPFRRFAAAHWKLRGGMLAS